ncbi:multidrug ABC transporter [Halobacillus andaensis]|uniref:Multidrug ABC transporter n=1 Tax=Halobacillus andaensis TaxID=1176239 RepID=A0A917B3Y6_HALAA|nr:efflux RND transporter permease subunit [Halobacillus andaensis]MBP2004376.1 HAE1 family hydrophobic/amphiphilic exporter-1 [Halobacillus andaensis]GGF22095.1 multidrug ABC transporter [Halobacillus andaensis]
MKLVNLSVKRPVGVIMVVAAILALGFVSLRSLTIDLYPEIDLPVAVVSTSYDEAAPQEVERLVSQPVESSVSAIEGLEVLQSQSQAGASLVFMQFSMGTDLDSTLLEVRENVDQVTEALPEGAGEPSVLRFDPQALPIMTIGLSGDSPEQLQRVAEDQLIPQLERQEGVASVDIEGGSTRQVDILIDRAKMASYELDTETITQTLNASNQAASAGSVEKGSQDIQIRIDGEFESIEDIEQTNIQSPSGAQVTLDQIAEVEEKYESDSVSEVGGESSVVLSIMKKTDGNTVETANNVRDALEEVEGDLPENADTEVVLDTSEFIKTSINSVVLNIILGGIFSIIVLMLFLKSFRATLVIGIAIPIAIISTFTLMYFTGETLNVLTMGGLALGIGMMVDSSIVILENIVSYRQRGYSMVESAKKGASELAPAVIASATTTLVVFLPIIFVEGIASELFTPLAITISFALITALAVSVTLIPMLSSKLLTKPLQTSGRRYWFDRFLQKVNDKYRTLLSKVLKWRKTTVALTLAAIVGSVAIIPSIGTEFIPPSDQGQIEIDVEMPAATSLEGTQETTEIIDQRLENFSEEIDVSYLSIGGGGMGGDIGNGSSDSATYTLQLVDPDQRERSTQDVMKQMDEELSDIPGAEISVTELDAGLGTGAPLQIQLNGPEYEVLDELSQQVTYVMEDVEGVSEPTSSTEEGRPEMNIEVDRDKASQYGLTEQEIIAQVQTSFTGQVATRYREASEEIDVQMILPEEERQTINDLEGMSVQTASGGIIPLSTIADLEQVQGPVNLLREDQQPQVNVESEIVDRDLGSTTEDVRAELESLNFPDGYTYEIGGQAQDMEEAFGDLGLALIFSIFLVYAVMAIQFENFLFPFIIMFSLPATIVGITTGLFVTGLPFSLPAFVGIIMLAGIVVNNAIVLVDYINILRRKGYDRTEAILDAGPNRLRPILMTTLTTVLGMVPLAIGIGQGAEAQQPLAVTIIFGLTVSSFFTLILIPVVYTYFDDLSKKITGIFRRKNRDEEA